MHIYMRHGNDNKTCHYKHDHSLKSELIYEEEIIKKTRKLIKKYGYPDTIYCSPFKRVRETVAIMIDYIKSKHKSCDIDVDPRLSRYFNSNERANPSVRNTTLKYNPPLNENGKMFKKRVDQVEHDINRDHGTTWCITHYLVIKRITKNNHIEIPKKMPFLYHVII